VASALHLTERSIDLGPSLFGLGPSRWHRRGCCNDSGLRARFPPMKLHPQLPYSVTFYILSAIFCAALPVSPTLASGQSLTIDQKISANIEERIRKSGADVAIAFRTFDGHIAYAVHNEESFHAASTMKIPVMIELFHQARQARLKLDDPLLVKNQFHSLADGSIYTLDPADDSEAELYKAAGQTRSLRQLSELMITASSNLATNLLIEKLGVDNIRATVHALGADGMNVLRGVEDNKAFLKGLNNTTTARGLQQFLEAIAHGEAVDQESSRQMIEILERQKFNEGIPAGLPPGTRVAHKTGEITKIHHDAAIVFAPKPFVLVILVRGLAETKDSAALMADITRLLYQATQ
jgi:beta-lactamase class A